MNEKAPNLTPPVKTKAANGEKAPKAPKEPKVPKEKKVRATGKYGYHPGATIEVVKDKQTNYRGQRLEWFELIKKFDGKLVSEFNEGAKDRVNGKGVKQTPSGWLRFYALDGSVKLIAPKEEPKAEPEKAAA